MSGNGTSALLDGGAELGRKFVSRVGAAAWSGAQTMAQILATCRRDLDLRIGGRLLRQPPAVKRGFLGGDGQ